MLAGCARAPTVRIDRRAANSGLRFPQTESKAATVSRREVVEPLSVRPLFRFEIHERADLLHFLDDRLALGARLGGAKLLPQFLQLLATMPPPRQLACAFHSTHDARSLVRLWSVLQTNPSQDRTECAPVRPAVAGGGASYQSRRRVVNDVPWPSSGGAAVITSED